MEAIEQPKSKIREVMDSGLYMTIVETGCGTALASRFYELPGTSKIIYNSKQPYSKEYEKKTYGDFKRSISKEFIKAVLDVEIKEAEGSNVNCIYAASFQLGDETSIFHGWIGLWFRERKYYMHFTCNSNDLIGDRSFKLSRVGELGIQILHSFINDDGTRLCDGTFFNLDQVYEDYNGVFLPNNHFLLSVQQHSVNDYPLMFVDGEPVRLVEELRKSRDVIVYKGSFDPLHHQHKKIMDYSIDKYTEGCYVPLGMFLISTDRYDKPSIPVSDVLNRVHSINEHGYPLIVCKSIYFYNTFDLFLDILGADKNFFIFPMGVDTIDRIVDVDLRKGDVEHNKLVKSIVDCYTPNFKMLVFDRIGSILNPLYAKYGKLIEIVTEGYEDDGTASSKIRAGLQKNKIDEN